MTYKNFPIFECAEAADKLIKGGATVFQKWTCEKCGERVTGNLPNVFVPRGRHEECGHVTDIVKSGCNYLTMEAVPANQPEKLTEILRRIGAEADTTEGEPNV